jgi:hypothetical protein
MVARSFRLSARHGKGALALARPVGTLTKAAFRSLLSATVHIAIPRSSAARPTSARRAHQAGFSLSCCPARLFAIAFARHSVQRLPRMRSFIRGSRLKRHSA